MATVVVGNPQRAEAVAASLTDPESSDRALRTIVEALSRRHSYSHSLRRHVAASRAPVPYSSTEDEAQVADIGDIKRAERIVCRIVGALDRDAAWKVLIAAAAEAAADGRQDTGRLVGMAEKIAEAGLGPVLRIRALGNIAIANPPYADMLLEKVEMVAREIPDPCEQAQALANVAATAEPGNPAAIWLIGLALTPSPWRCSLRHWHVLTRE